MEFLEGKEGGEISKGRKKECKDIREDAKFQVIERRKRDRSASEYAERKSVLSSMCVCVCVCVRVYCVCE